MSDTNPTIETALAAARLYGSAVWGIPPAKFVRDSVTLIFRLESRCDGFHITIWMEGIPLGSIPEEIDGSASVCGYTRISEPVQDQP